MGQSTRWCWSHPETPRQVPDIAHPCPTSGPSQKGGDGRRRTSSPPWNPVSSCLDWTGTAQAPGGQEPNPGKGRRVKGDRTSRVPGSKSWATPCSQFKDKTKNFKTAVTEPYIPSAGLFWEWGPMQLHWSLTYQWIWSWDIVLCSFSWGREATFQSKRKTDTLPQVSFYFFILFRQQLVFTEYILGITLESTKIAAF